MSNADIIESLVRLRDRILAEPPPKDAEVLYYPPALIDRARIFWAGRYRIEPTRLIPTDT